MSDISTGIYTVAAPSTRMRIDIVQDADWNDALPPILEAGQVMDLTGKALELVVRPTWDHEALILALSSEGPEPAITFDDVAQGCAAIFVPQSAVADLPAGTWDFFLRLKETAGAGFAYTEIARGPIVIHPGKPA